jgi:hypothetical protein
VLDVIVMPRKDIKHKFFGQQFIFLILKGFVGFFHIVGLVPLLSILCIVIVSMANKKLPCSRGRPIYNN